MNKSNILSSEPWIIIKTVLLNDNKKSFQNLLKSNFHFLKVRTSISLILHRGNKGDCLHAPWSLSWCPWNAPVEICNFLIRVPFTEEKMPWCPLIFTLSKKEAQVYINRPTNKVTHFFVCKCLENMFITNHKNVCRPTVHYLTSK